MTFEIVAIVTGFIFSLSLLDVSCLSSFSVSEYSRIESLNSSTGIEVGFFMDEGILLKLGLLINPIEDLKGTFFEEVFAIVVEGTEFGFEGALKEIELAMFGDLIVGNEVSFVEPFKLRLRTGDLPRKIIGSVESD